MPNELRRLLAVLCLALFGTAYTAEAAAIPAGATFAVYAAVVRGTAVAYDSVNDIYLVVSANGAGNLRGRFVSNGGSPSGAGSFVIQASGNYTHFPRVAFSPDADGGAGGFLVTWHESDLAGGNTSIHGRIVSFAQNGPIGADSTLATDGSWWEAGAAVAYASGSKEFLVAYPRAHGVWGVSAVRVSNSGAALSAPITVARNGQYEDNPSVAYNPNTDQFLVSYAGYSDAGRFAFVDARLVQAGSGALLGAGATRVATAVGTFITDTTFISSTGQFLVAWFNGAASMGRLVGADGSALGNITTLSTRWKANDALSVAFNPRTNTSLLVSHYGLCGTPATPICVEDGGVEIDTNGNPVDNGFQMTGGGGKGNFYPRLTASTREGNWLVSTANSFAAVYGQLISGTGVSGQPGPTPTPPPTAPQPNPKMNVDYPANATTVQTNGFLVSGWALDLGATTSTGVDVVQVWAYPVGSTTPTFLGTAQYGISRGDVAAYVGGNFANCGYALNASLPAAGAYDIAVFAHSTVSGTFNNVKVTRVNAVSSSTNPKMWLDVPAQNATTSQSIIVAGWAIDLGSSTGTGVDMVHVWAYPSSGASPILLGTTTGGEARGDVGAYAGSTRFSPSGFHVTGTLPVGDYQLVAFAHSTVTNTFNNVIVVPIKVR